MGRDINGHIAVYAWGKDSGPPAQGGPFGGPPHAGPTPPKPLLLSGFKPHLINVLYFNICRCLVNPHDRPLSPARRRGLAVYLLIIDRDGHPGGEETAAAAPHRSICAVWWDWIRHRGEDPSEVGGDGRG